MERGTGKKTVAEFKEELQTSVKAIVEDKEAGIQLIQCLSSALSDVKLKVLGPNSIGNVPPKELLCPLSGEVMSDPVIMYSSQTYDRKSIEKWLQDTPEESKEILSHIVFLPNQFANKIVSKWWQENGLNPSPETSSSLPDECTGVLSKLLLKLSSPCTSDIKDAAKELRELTSDHSSRHLFASVRDSVNQLCSPLQSGDGDGDLDLQEDIVVTLLHVSIHEDNQKPIVENPIAITVLINSLKSGSLKTKASAATAIFYLASVESNAKLIGESGSIKSLLDLIDDGHPRLVTNASAAIYSLCKFLGNIDRAVSDGAVRVIMKKLEEQVQVEVLLTLLDLLSYGVKGAKEIGELQNIMPYLLDIIKGNTNDDNNEKCTSLLYRLCSNAPLKLYHLRAEEIQKLINSTTSTAKTKRDAQSLLELMKKYFPDEVS